MALTNAEKQARHRARQEVLLDQMEELREALTLACERGRRTDLVNHLPDGPGQWVPELTRRLSEVNVLTYGRAAKRKRKRRGEDGVE